jgi:Glycosyl transferases group 1
VVRNGPDPERMQRRSSQPELRNGCRHLCCYVGLTGPQDGVDLAVRAADVLVHQLGRQDCSFALLGDGDTYQPVRALVRKLGLESYVTIPGFLGDDELAAYLSTADLGVCPEPRNPFNEVSTMVKTMEYMAFELPVVAFDLKETRFSAGDAAVYVKPNDVEEFAAAIAALLDDPDRRAAMGRAGRRRVEEALGWPLQVPASVGVFDELTGRAASPAIGSGRMHRSCQDVADAVRPKDRWPAAGPAVASLCVLAPDGLDVTSQNVGPGSRRACSSSTTSSSSAPCQTWASRSRQRSPTDYEPADVPYSRAPRSGSAVRVWPSRSVRGV